MSKITIEFNEDEEDDARTALDGYKWKLVVWDMDQLLRSTTKYESSILKHSEQATQIECEIAEKLRDDIRNILGNYDLNID